MHKPYLTNYNLLIKQCYGSSLSNFVHNLADGIHEIKCEHGYATKKCEMCGINCEDCQCCPVNKNVEDDLILYNCLCYNKNYQKGLIKI